MTNKKNMTAAERHAEHLTKELVKWDGEWPPRVRYGELFFDKPDTPSGKNWIYGSIGLDLLAKAETDALDIIRKQYSHFAKKIDRKLIETALSGDHNAIKLFYQRLENWSPGQKVEVEAGVSDELKDVLEDIYGGK